MATFVVFASVLLLLVGCRDMFIGAASTTTTGLSGFGARSLQKTIFSSNNITSNTPLSTPQTIANAIFSRDPKLLTDRPRLWARISRDPDVLYFKLKLTNGEADNTRIIRVSTLDHEDNWRIEECSDDLIDGNEKWVPIEGIYGVYRLPSGIMWVLISKTDNVYTAPPLSGHTNDSKPWWQIRKVANLELVHLAYPDMVMSTTQLKEEVRQLRLLRHSLKEHNFYHVPSDDSFLVKDMTCNLQDTFESTPLDQLAAGGNLHFQWYDGSPETRPDPRFFWNQAAVEPILQWFESSVDNPAQRSLLSDLLSVVLPVTSAFVGVESNVNDPKTGLSYDQLLISRRSRFRAGTRFTRRGADGSGAVANFAETEQICLFRNSTQDGAATVQTVLSHLQTRGSIPLRWSSPADVKTYRPRVHIGTDPLAQARALRLHLLEQFSYYVEPQQPEKQGQQLIQPTNASGIARLIFVNLIDKKKDQGRLGRAFDAVLRAVMDVHSVVIDEPPAPETKEMEGERPKKRRKFAYLYDLRSDPDSDSEQVEFDTEDEAGQHAQQLLCSNHSVKHVWFDFHAEVKDGRWDRLQGLLEEVQPALADHGYFMANWNSTGNQWIVQKKQNAIVRTNCMDCLDRTNVVQSLFGRYVFFHQLHDMFGKKSSNDTQAQEVAWGDYVQQFRGTPTAIPWASGEKAHRLLWADNADAISRLYAGTPALKGDFTRTGERTKRGALNDGVNSLQRYYLNNFLDADRQEGMDLLVGFAGFSTVDTLDESSRSLSQELDEKKYISIKQAARENFFGTLIGKMEDEQAQKLEQELDVAIESNSTGDASFRDSAESIDLRWISGDLQSHMISNADAMLEEYETASDNNNKKSPGFSSGKALLSIDRRSYSDLPWWAGSDDDDGSAILAPSPPVVEVAENTENKEARELQVPEYQRLPRLERAQVLAILLMGLRAPTRISIALVALLMIIFMPDIM